jgi:kynurenine formamidase
MKHYDLSHPITPEGSCRFAYENNAPNATFQEGESNGLNFVTSVLSPLASNVGTHMDLAGHIYPPCENAPLVGEIPIDRFMGKAPVLDCRLKMKRLGAFFNASGMLKEELTDSAVFTGFVNCFQSLAISLRELVDMVGAKFAEQTGDPIKGVIFLCGNARYWKPGRHLAHQYRYFFNVFLEDDAARWLADQGISFVGIDSFQLEDPIINFRGDEAFVVGDARLRQFLLAKLNGKPLYSNHRTFLNSQIAIYENLNLAEELAGCTGEFVGPPLNIRLPGVNDNALCRPVFTVA